MKCLNHIYNLKYLYNTFENNLIYYKKYSNNLIKFSEFKSNFIYLNNEFIIDKKNLKKSSKLLFLSNECLFFYSTSYFMFVPFIFSHYNNFFNLDIYYYKNQPISSYVLLCSGITSLLHWGNYNPDSYIRKIDMLFVFLDLISISYDYVNILNKSIFIKEIINYYLFIILLFGELDLFCKDHLNYFNIKYSVNNVETFIHNIVRILGFGYSLSSLIKFDNIFQYLLFFLYVFFLDILFYIITYNYIPNNRSLNSYDLFLFSILGIFFVSIFVFSLPVIINLTK